jgi:hypothetical protein
MRQRARPDLWEPFRLGRGAAGRATRPDKSVARLSHLAHLQACAGPEPALHPRLPALRSVEPPSTPLMAPCHIDALPPEQSKTGTLVKSL